MNLRRLLCDWRCYGRVLCRPKHTFVGPSDGRNLDPRGGFVLRVEIQAWKRQAGTGSDIFDPALGNVMRTIVEEQCTL